jgi:hypothetical protein
VSRTLLWVVIGVAAFAVVTLAVLTPTVIAGGDDDHARSVRVASPATPAPLPNGRGLLPELRRCLERHGLGSGRPRSDALPNPDQFRGALRDCLPRFRG